MTENTYLAHHGVKGMKWGVRRTPAQLGHRIAEKASAVNRPRLQRPSDASNSSGSDNQTRKAAGDKKPGMSTAKKVAIGAAVVGGVALAAYGGKKYHDYIRDTNAKYHQARGEALVRVYKQKVDVRDWRRNNEIFEAMQAKTPTGYTVRKARAVQDADERVYANTANKIRGYEKRKADSDTFRQARANVKEYKRMRNNSDASGSVSAQVFRKELDRHVNRYGLNRQHPHNRRRYLNEGL